MAEAQAAGYPVIAYKGGSANEIILDGMTGLLFDEPSVESLIKIVRRFENEAKLDYRTKVIKIRNVSVKKNYRKRIHT